ncbi:MAG: hypothetical protein HYR72_25795 [Deltaproteobacteria bacterium]|nr:hypothetical protein [Deltaproteobacteria bacterium]MBI3386803.1 hypothetical protein [Deltaproteobacteria bacterium]
MSKRPQATSDGTPPRQSGWSKMSAVAGFLALCLSVFTLYETWLRPFDPIFGVGYMVFDKQSPRTAIEISLTITNRGAVGGSIDEFVITLQRAEDRYPQWLYEGDILIDEAAYLCRQKLYDADTTDEKQQTATCGGYEKESFRPVFLLGRQQTSMAMHFFPRTTSHFPAIAGGVSNGTYLLKLLARIDGDKTYKEVFSHPLTVNSRTFIASKPCEEPLVTLSPATPAPTLGRRWW